jgi:hypothetical protein
MFRFVGLMVGIVLGWAAVAPLPALGQSGVQLAQSFRADLRGFSEVPSISTAGEGRFEADLNCRKARLTTLSAIPVWRARSRRRIFTSARRRPTVGSSCSCAPISRAPRRAPSHVPQAMARSAA